MQNYLASHEIDCTRSHANHTILTFPILPVVCVVFHLASQKAP